MRIDRDEKNGFWKVVVHIWGRLGYGIVGVFRLVYINGTEKVELSNEKDGKILFVNGMFDGYVEGAFIEKAEVELVIV